MGQPWTEEKTISAKKLYEAGFSPSYIAKELRTTRNAVIGKIFRDKWKRSIGTWQPKQHKAAPQKHRYTSKAAKLIGIAKKNKDPTYKPAAPFEDVINELDLEIPQSRRRTILTLTPFCCRFPVGDPREPSFFFCGAETSVFMGYCERHHAVVWKSPA